MSRLWLICLFGAAGSVVLALVGRWGFSAGTSGAGCSACSQKLDSGGLSRAGAGALRMCADLRKEMVITETEAVMLRMWMNPRTDSAVRYDPRSVAPGHEFLMVRCQAVKTAVELIGHGDWLDENEKGRSWCALESVALSDDAPQVRRAIVYAIVSIIQTDFGYAAQAANLLGRLCDDPDATIRTAAFDALSQPRQAWLHPH